MDVRVHIRADRVGRSRTSAAPSPRRSVHHDHTAERADRENALNHRDRIELRAAAPAPARAPALARLALRPLVAAIACLPLYAWANCSGGPTVVCDDSAPNPFTATIGTGASSTIVSVELLGGAQLMPGNASAISLGNATTIRLQSGATALSQGDSGDSAWGSGHNTIEFGSANFLDIAAGAGVFAAGGDPTAEAVNIFGGNNHIVSRGEIRADNTTAIRIDAAATGTANSIDNYGTIGGSGTAIADDGSAGLQLNNYRDARIDGSVLLGSGDDAVSLQTGSFLTGDLDGGTGSNALTLNGDDAASGALAGTVRNFRTVTKSETGTWILNGDLLDAARLDVQAGTLVLNATAFTSTINVSAGATLQIGNGDATGDVTDEFKGTTIANNGTVRFDRSDDAFSDSLISGSGGIVQAGTGTTTLFFDSTYTGTTRVASGGLYIDGNQSAATGAVTVADGATLGGAGTIGGAITLEGGARLDPGGNAPAPGTLTLLSDLNLGSGSVLNFSLGAAGTAGGSLNDLVVVGGNLVLDGTLDVVVPPLGRFDPGLYRLFDYAGTLTDNGLALGQLPSPQVSVQTSIASQVNLVNSAGMTLNFWDGAAGARNSGSIEGGDGVWQNASGNDNWTDAGGALNAPYANGAFAIFSAQPGTVTVDDSLGAVSASGLQFAVDGYRLNGGVLELSGSAADPARTLVAVGDGSAAGAAYVANVDATFGGASGLVKTDLGTLVLNAANTYAGGTAVEGGVLQIASDASLGAAGSALRLANGAAVRTATDWTSTRTVALDAGGGVFDIGGIARLSGRIDGAGRLSKTGAGELVLTADNAYAGGTAVSAGTLRLGDGGATGSIAGDVLDDALLVFDRSDTYTFAGTISGRGAVEQRGGGTTVLTARNSAAGPHAVRAGALMIGDSGHVDASLTGKVSVDSGATLGGYGSVAGDVVNLGTLAVADAFAAMRGGGGFAVGGALDNAGTVRLGGAGVGNTLTVSSYVGHGGTLQLNTVLQGDGAASDRLVIDGGRASGATAVRIDNLGGTGAATPGDGILVVQARNGAITDAEAFALAGRVAAGPYEYLLYRGDRSGAAADSWYLRSQSTDTGTPGNPGNPGNPQEPGTPAPNYRREISAYAALPSMVLEFGRATLDGLHRRRGETVGAEPETWMRAIGRDGEWHARRGGILRDGPSFETRFSGVQAGHDLFAEGDGALRSRLGVYGLVGHGRGDVSHYDGTAAGSNEFDAYGAGLYWTGVGTRGYLDAVVQGALYKARTGSWELGRARTRAFALSGSVEAGYDWHLGAGWIAQPQAQLTFQRMNPDDLDDRAASVRLDRTDSVAGRVGLRVAHRFDGARALSLWATANLWREFSGDSRIAVSAVGGEVPFGSDLGGRWYEANIGIDLSAGRNSGWYAALGYRKGLGGSGIEAVDGSAGFKLRW